MEYIDKEGVVSGTDGWNDGKCADNMPVKAGHNHQRSEMSIVI